MDRYEKVLARVKSLNAAGWALASSGQGMGRRVEPEFSFCFIYHTGMPAKEMCDYDILNALEMACESAEKVEADWNREAASRR